MPHHIKLPSSVSSEVSSPSLCSPSSIGAFLMQCLPSFWMAGATSQSRVGTSIMRSHSKGSGRQRSPSSRSMTCVILDFGETVGAIMSVLMQPQYINYTVYTTPGYPMFYNISEENVPVIKFDALQTYYPNYIAGEVVL